MLRDFIREYLRIVLPVAILFALVAIGTIGYMVIDSYSIFDAFYMTIITIATVGYGEVQPLSNAGKMFTVFLIITSFGTFCSGW
jgi:voltage-gated potassium channel